MFHGGHRNNQQRFFATGFCSERRIMLGYARVLVRVLKTINARNNAGTKPQA